MNSRKEFNLSEKIEEIRSDGHDGLPIGEYLHPFDVKEFIKLLKEELRKELRIEPKGRYSFPHTFVGDTIDKLAGEKLV